jgi:twitching motility protein PilI
MANKEALRALQLRLANRLQAARERPREAGWLAVESGGAGFLLPLAQAGEIHATAVVADVPHAQPWLAGVANLRGELCAVVDLARFLRLRKDRSPACSGPVVALNAALHLNSAVRVDRLVGLRDASQLTPVADSGAHPAFVTGCWNDLQGQSWQALDLAVMAATPMFLEVAERPPILRQPATSS